MVVAFCLLAAVAVGIGWVLQHRVVDPADYGDRVEPGWHQPGLTQLMRRPLWWSGIAALSAGQTLSGVALQTGPITLVAPLLATNLLFAFLARAVLIHHRPPRRDLLGATGFTVAVAAFVVIGGPHVVARGTRLAGPAVNGAVAAGVAVLAIALLAAGVGRGVAASSVSAALAAGVLYGLQDVATRAGLVLTTREGLARLVVSVWPYTLLAAAAAAVLLTQRAFRAARLDYALPPIAATQPVIGVLLGVPLVGDRLSLTPPALVVEAGCLAVLIVSVVALSRSTALRGLRPRRLRQRSAPAAADRFTK